MPTAPERLGPYTIRRAIGRGGMGIVYEGVDQATGKVAAVKLLAAEMASRSDLRERFEAEIESLRKLNHPNIVRMFGFGRDDDHLFYAMEYVAGSSMEDQLQHGRVYTWREVVQIGIDLARALRHAHDRGVIHRDIKPGNLLMSESGDVKLSDFGIARLFGNNRLTSVGSVLGTAEFMSPEQAQGKPVDPRTDLYSLGGVMYVMLARRSLFDAKTFVEMLEKQRTQVPTPLHRLAPDVPPGLEQIIHRLLEKDPDRRYATATVLARRLEDLAETLTLSPMEEQPPLQKYEQTNEQQEDMPAPDLPRDGSDDFVLNPSGQAAADKAEANSIGPDTPVQSQEILIDQFAITRAATHLEDDSDLPETPSNDSAAGLQLGTARYGPTQLQTPTPSTGGSSPSLALPQIPAAASPQADQANAADVMPARAGKFITVTPGDLDHSPVPETHAGPIALQIGLLAAGLLVFGLLAWQFLQPPTADSLYRRVETISADQSEESILQAEDAIGLFVDRFPNDSRSEHLRDLKQQIETLHLEHRLDLAAKGLGPKGNLLPIQRAYLDALTLSRSDPESGAASFQAIIDLFSSTDDKKAADAPTRQCIELAHRRLAQLAVQNSRQQTEATAVTEKRLDHADAIRANDAAGAARIYRATIELYGHRRWAETLVRRAQQSLDSLKPAVKTSP